MSAKNFMEHDIDTIKLDIEKKGYSELDNSYIANFYQDINLREYFLEHDILVKIKFDKFIFTKYSNAHTKEK